MSNRSGILGRTYRHMNRYREVVMILIKHGFGDLISRTNIDKFIDIGKKYIPGKKEDKAPPFSSAERIRMVLEELGPTFVKFGQIMSNRPDLLPPDIILELEKLQAAVPPFAGEQAVAVIEKELGRPLEKLFEHFDIVPLASASIAQVHKAILPTGDLVVVKVQRVGIEQVIETDLEIMQHLAQLMEKHLVVVEELNLVAVVKQFAGTIRKELDFNLEKMHMDRFAVNMHQETRLYLPRVFKDYCTSKILTMEFVGGFPVTDLKKISQYGCDPGIIASRCCNLVLSQIFEYGFFHADPHPGNILVLENNIICFLDFGMMGVLLPRHKELLVNLITAFAKRDAAKIANILKQYGQSSRRSEDDQLEERLFGLIETYSYLPLKDINMGSLLKDVVEIIMDFKLKIPSGIYLLIKALITVEGVVRKLDPTFDMVVQITPYARKLLRERFNPLSLIKDLFFSVKEISFFLTKFPEEFAEIVNKIKRGTIKIEFEHKGLEPMLSKHEQISNRIAFAIVLAALIIGSSLIVLADVPPHWKEVPIIGLVGYLIAGMMGFWLLYSILRHGKM